MTLNDQTDYIAIWDEHEGTARSAVDAAQPIVDEYLMGRPGHLGCWDLLNKGEMMRAVAEHIDATGTTPGPHDLAMWMIDEAIGKDVD